MELTENQIEYIQTNLNFYGINNAELNEDLLDHICTIIENSNSDSFEDAYHTAIHKLGGYRNFREIQRETDLQKFSSAFAIRKKYVFGSAAISLVLLGTGVLFKIMLWPFASFILFGGFLAFLLIAIPIFFWDRYKTAVENIH